MNPFEKRKLGRTDVEVTCLGFGGASMGNLYKPVNRAEVVEAIRTAYSLGVRYFDTAPMYGFGQSEELFGEAISMEERGSFTLSTKVGRLIMDGPPTADSEDTPFVDIPDRHTVFDYSRDGVLRSLDESRKRLKIDRFDIVHIHDPDVKNCYREALEQAFPTLAELRSQGVIKAVSAGMNQAEMLTDFAKNADFDCFLLAGRYTLLDQIALKELLPLCEKKQIGIIIGGAYNSGILATGAVEGAWYNYAPAPPDIMEKTRRLETFCRQKNVPLKAAALQFPFGHPTVATNIPGTRTRSRFEENLNMMTFPIPADFWAEMKQEGLLPEEAPTPPGA